MLFSVNGIIGKGHPDDGHSSVWNVNIGIDALELRRRVDFVSAFISLILEDGFQACEILFQEACVFAVGDVVVKRHSGGRLKNILTSNFNFSGYKTCRRRRDRREGICRQT